MPATIISGEVTDYIPEIVFTGLIVDRAAAESRRDQIVAFLQGVMEGTRWVYDPANDETLLALTKELTQAEGKYGRQALDYMRGEAGLFTGPFHSRVAFAKSIELMQKAGLADRAACWRSAKAVLDDSFRARRAKIALMQIYDDLSFRFSCSMQELPSASFAECSSCRTRLQNCATSTGLRSCSTKSVFDRRGRLSC